MAFFQSSWLIVTVLMIIVLVLAVALILERRLSRQSYTMYKKAHQYEVDSADRYAIATFIADHLDDVVHPNRNDVVRILAHWGSQNE